MLKLVNINDHPTNHNKKVFYFMDGHKAEYFQALLEEKQLFYEKQIDFEGDKCIYYGIRKSDFREVQKLNYLCHAKFRKPMIQDPFFRYLLIIGMAVAIAISIIGAIVAN